MRTSLLLLLLSLASASAAPLHQHAEQNEMTPLKNCLEKQRVKVNLPDKHGNTALILASSQGHVAIVRYLLDRKADPNLANQEGQTALMAAVSGGHLEVVDALLKGGAKIKGVGQDGFQLLELAATSSRGKKAVPMLSLLVARGANPKHWLDDKNLLHLACQADALPQIMYLVSSLKFDVNQPTRDVLKLRPLHFVRGVQAADWLIEHGAKVDATDTHGNTPLHHAVMQPEIVTCLLAHGAPVNALDQDSWSSLYQACMLNQLATVERLLKAGADPNLGDSPLFGAIQGQNECVPILKLLIEKGANPKALDENGQTLLHQAAAGGTPEVAAYLVDTLGLDVNQVDKKGACPLRSANYRPDMTAWLLSRGARVQAVDSQGETALHGAVIWGKPEVVKLLLKAGADRNGKNGDGKNALQLAQERLKLVQESNLGATAVDEANTIVKLLSSP
jgi:ankyrin repeat protein